MDLSNPATVTAVATEVLAGAAILSLLASIVVAFFTGRAARSTARAAKVAEDSLEEVRWERELDVAPYLALEWSPKRFGDHMVARLRNIGRGPALGSILISGNRDQEVGITTRLDIGADQVAESPLGLLPTKRRFPKELYTDPNTPGASLGGNVMYCTSVTRTAVYRFRQGYPADEPWRSGQAPPYWAAALRDSAPDLVPVPRPALLAKPSGRSWWSRITRWKGHTRQSMHD